MKPFRISRTSLIWLAGGLFAVAAASLSPRAPAQDKPATSAKAALTVNTVVTEPVEWPQFLLASGSVAAWQEAIVGSEIGGFRLVDLHVNVGDRVRKDQELARLQSDTINAERDQTRASLAEAEATQAEAQANANRAREIEASGALSAQQIAQYLTAELTAKARVDVLKARLKADDLRLAKTRILAPDDGTITARSATLGAVVQPGQELFRLIRRDRIEWRAELPAADLARVKPGMTVSLTTPDKNKVPGRVRMVAPTLDPQTRNGVVYVDLESGKSGGKNGGKTGGKDANKGSVSAGMFASGEIEIGRSKLQTLPQSAVLLRDGYSYVFRLDPENRVIQTKVNVGQRAGDRLAITSGLDANVPVVASGVGFLADGDLVRVVGK